MNTMYDLNFGLCYSNLQMLRAFFYPIKVENIDFAYKDTHHHMRPDRFAALSFHKLCWT